MRFLLFVSRRSYPYLDRVVALGVSPPLLLTFVALRSAILGGWTNSLCNTIPVWFNRCRECSPASKLQYIGEHSRQHG